MNSIYVIDRNNVKLTGRCWYDEDRTVWFALSGSGFEFHFKGKKLDLCLVGDAASEVPENEENWVRYAVYVNGERVTDSQLDFVTKEIPVINSEETVEADIKFIKLSECAMSTVGVKPIICDGDITPVPDCGTKLEFIGDSITCGYGVDVNDPNLHFKTSTEDFTKGYAYKTAQLLGADVRAFSISGWGIISGYTDNGEPRPDQLIPPYYKKLGFSYEKFDDRDSLAPQDLDYDFSQYVPDLIVINIGTNDDSYCTGHEDRFELYVTEYEKFLETVHECNPSAKLLCCMGIMNDEICPYMEKAAALFTERTGFGNVFTFRFKPHDGSTGYGADWHPSPETHTRAAAALAQKIKEIL